MAVMYEYGGENVTAERITRERLDLDDEGSTVRTIDSHELLASSMMHQGRYAEAEAHRARVLAATRELPLEPMTAMLPAQTHGWMSGAMVFTSRPGDALAHNAEAMRLADTAGDELRARARCCNRRSSASITASRGMPHARRRGRDDRTRAPPALSSRLHVHPPRLVSLARRELDDAVREVRMGIRTSLSVGARMDVPSIWRFAPNASSAPVITTRRSKRSTNFRPRRRQPRLLLPARDLSHERRAADRAIAEEQQSSFFGKRLAV